MTTLKQLQMLFSTEERLRILSVILEGKEINIPAIAKITKTNKGLVSRYCSSLVVLGILKKINSKYKLDISSPITRAVKVLLNISKLKIPMPKWVDRMGVYGSFSKGTNTEESDVDIWVIPKRGVQQAEIGELETKLSKRLENEVHILLLTEERIERLKKEDKPFFYSLVFGSFILKGDTLEEAKL
jgi:predicted nucleotidyltransferase